MICHLRPPKDLMVWSKRKSIVIHLLMICHLRPPKDLMVWSKRKSIVIHLLMTRYLRAKHVKVWSKRTQIDKNSLPRIVERKRNYNFEPG